MEALSAILFSRDPSDTEVICGDDQPFPIASVTKTFTAALCLEPGLCEHLDRPFCETMPYFRVQDENATRSMTPRDALCHFSGLEPETESWVRSTLSRKEFVSSRLGEYRFAPDFRSRHRYSNIMYAVLGQWLEEQTGLAWETLVEQRFRRDMGLESLQPLEPGWEEICPPPTALREGRLEQIPPFFSRKNHLIAPASELCMTMRDLARWGQAHLQLPPDDERWRPHSFVSDQRSFPEFGPLEYGLGWRLDSVNGRRRVWHSGQCSGYSTLLSLYPEEGSGLAAAINRTSAVDSLHALDLKHLHRNQT